MATDMSANVPDNADFLLVSIGIFDNPAMAAQSRARMQPSEEAYIGRGKTYYHFAYTYSQQMHRKNVGVSDVLEKLSMGFEKYIRILLHMRGEYLDLVKRLSDGGFNIPDHEPADPKASAERGGMGRGLNFLLSTVMLTRPASASIPNIISPRSGSAHFIRAVRVMGLVKSLA